MCDGCASVTNLLIFECQNYCIGGSDCYVTDFGAWFIFILFILSIVFYTWVCIKTKKKKKYLTWWVRKQKEFHIWEFTFIIIYPWYKNKKLSQEK